MAKKIFQPKTVVFRKSNVSASASISANDWFNPSVLGIGRIGIGVIYNRNSASFGMIRVIGTTTTDAISTLQIISGNKYDVGMIAFD